MFQGITRRDFIKTTSLAALGFIFAGCGGENSAATGGKADLVVYGKIFTSEDNKIVEAFAVKDGKFVYVGDKAGVEAFIENGKTEIIDYTDKGLVMPSCGNGHAHYLSTFAVQSFGTMIAYEDDVNKFLTEIVPATVKKAKETGAKAVYGMGWEFQTFKDNMPTRQQLDAICNDIPMFFADEENHKSLVNTLLLVKAGDMHFVLGFTHEIDSWMNLDESLTKAADVQKYASAHVKTNWIKLFIDGTPESGTGFIEPVYLDGHQGIVNWTEEEITEITRKANANGVTMHIHAMGNAGVNRVVNSYVNGGKPEMRNTIVHLRNVNEPDYKRMAENNIYVTSGMIWHHNSKEIAENLKVIFPESMADKGYPMKSFFDNGIKFTKQNLRLLILKAKKFSLHDMEISESERLCSGFFLLPQ